MTREKYYIPTDGLKTKSSFKKKKKKGERPETSSPTKRLRCLFVSFFSSSSPHTSGRSVSKKLQASQDTTEGALARKRLHTEKSPVLYLHIMGNTVPDNKNHPRLQWYGGHCLRYGHTPVGKNYLLLVYIMEDTAPDNAVRIRRVHGPRDRRWGLDYFPVKWNERVFSHPLQCQFKKGGCVVCFFCRCVMAICSAPAVGQHAHLF